MASTREGEKMQCQMFSAAFLKLYFLAKNYKNFISFLIKRFDAQNKNVLLKQEKLGSLLIGRDVKIATIFA